MTNFIDHFVCTLIGNCLGEDPLAHVVDGPPIVKRHTGDRLATAGDLSFPLAAQRWGSLLKDGKPTNGAETIFEVSNANATDPDECVRQMAIDLQTTVSQIRLAEERVLIFLNRPFVFGTLVGILAQGDSYGKEAKGTEVVAIVNGEEFGEAEASPRCLTEYRCQLIQDILVNLIEYSKYQLGTGKAVVQLSVSYKSCSKTIEEGVSNVLCGVVRDGTGKQANKMTSMTTAEYISIRRKHMELMAQHKYGVRIKDSQVFAEMSRQLGMAAVTVDMMEVKHSSPITLSIQSHCGGASRGAAFILYNSARIDKLIRTYDQSIASGHYSAPEQTAFDWGLLKEEEEWQLMFNYILEFPRVVRRALGDLAAGSLGGPHVICSFLSGLVRCFSVYYRRVRILDHNRKHLMATLHCRMKLVIAVQSVLHQALALLNIRPIQNM